jgi:surfactin synthase thioesterase subunit
MSDAEKWIHRLFGPADSDMRLICLPHAGGSAVYFRPITRTLAERCEVLSIQYPGRQSRRNETPFESITAIAEVVAAHISALPEKPFALFGHSMGALIAFEIARGLEAEGLSPLALFVSGRRAPGSRRDNTVELHKAEDSVLVEELRQMSGTDNLILADKEIMGMVLPPLRADYKAVETYRFQPGEKLKAPIHAYIGDSDPKVTAEEVEEWADYTTGQFAARVLPGGHFYLDKQSAEVFGSVGQVLDGLLDRAESAVDSGS